MNKNFYITREEYDAWNDAGRPLDSVPEVVMEAVAAEGATLVVVDELPENPVKLEQITLRFPHHLMDDLRSFAKENHYSLAEIMRWAVTGNLSEHLQSVRVLDYEQGEEIRREIRLLMDKISDIEAEMKREGSNLNQATKALNSIIGMEVDGPVSTGFVEEINRIQSVQQECMETYVSATREVGDRLCRILG